MSRATDTAIGLGAIWRADGRSHVLRIKASYKVIEQLVPEIDDMFTRLKLALPRARKRRIKKI